MLCGQKLVALLGFLVLLDGNEVHRPHAVHAILQLGNLVLDTFPVCLQPLGLHLLEGGHGDLDLARVSLGGLEVLHLHFAQIDLVLGLHSLAEVFDHHVVLRQLNLELRAALLRFAQLGAY